MLKQCGKTLQDFKVAMYFTLSESHYDGNYIKSYCITLIQAIAGGVDWTQLVQIEEHYMSEHHLNSSGVDLCGCISA